MFVFRWACCSWWVGGFFYVARMMMRKQWQRAKFQKGTPVGLYSERPLISLLLDTPQPLSASWKSASLCKLLSPIIFPSTHGYGSFWLVLLIAFSILILSFPWSQWHACLSNMHSKFQIVFLFFTFFFFSSLYSPQRRLHHWCIAHKWISSLICQFTKLKCECYLEWYYIQIYVITQKLIKTAKRFCYPP